MRLLIDGLDVEGLLVEAARESIDEVSSSFSKLIGIVREPTHRLTKTQKSSFVMP